MEEWKKEGHREREGRREREKEREREREREREGERETETDGGDTSWGRLLKSVCFCCIILLAVSDESLAYDF